MDKPKKSLVQSLHDRSTVRQLSKSQSSSQLRLPQLVTMDEFDRLYERVERLENEANRYNKVLNLYIDRIEELETTVKKYENEFKRSKMLINNPMLRGGIASARASMHASNEVKISAWVKFTQLFKQRPTLETLISQNIYHNEPCFDTELENVIKHDQYPTVPRIVVECIRLVEEKAKLSPTEGLYRVSGNHVEIQKIRFCIDANDYDCLKNIKDIHTIIGVLKLFLREIKSPLLRISEANAFIGPSRDWTLATIKHKTETLKTLVRSLPEQNRDTLDFFFRHLSKLSRMPLQFVNARSLAVSITPTIFHFTSNNAVDIHTTLKESESLTNCLEIMIEYHDRIFETLSQNISKKLARCLSNPCILGQ